MGIEQFLNNPDLFNSTIFIGVFTAAVYYFDSIINSKTIGRPKTIKNFLGLFFIIVFIFIPLGLFFSVSETLLSTDFSVIGLSRPVIVIIYLILQGIVMYYIISRIKKLADAGNLNGSYFFIFFLFSLATIFISCYYSLKPDVPLIICLLLTAFSFIVLTFIAGAFPLINNQYVEVTVQVSLDHADDVSGKLIQISNDYVTILNDRGELIDINKSLVKTIKYS